MNIPLKNILFTGRIFLITSALLFAGMMYFASNTYSFINNTIETNGTIAAYTQKDEAGSDGRIRTSFFPVIEYTDTRGTSYRINSDTAMNSEVSVFIKARETEPANSRYRVPEIKIRYSRTNPEEAHPSRSFWDMWGTSIAYGILALIFSVTGTALMQMGDPENQQKK